MKNMAPKLVNLRNSEHQEHEEHLKVKIEHRKMFPQMFIMYLFGGTNHFGGGGPVSNGDCPADAIAAVSTSFHTCVIQKKKGICIKLRIVF